MDQRTCAVVGCDRTSKASEFCIGHRQRIRRTGSPGPAEFRRPPGSTPPTCPVDSCDEPVRNNGLCRGHAERLRRGGSIDATPLRRKRGSEPPPCSVEGCDDPAVGRTYCSRHYQRWYRLGEPGDADIPRYGQIAVCSAEGCERAHRTRGYCDTHYRRWQRGWPTDSLRFLVIKERSPVMTYSAAHGRIRALRGPARDRDCACGGPADSWAYQHNDPEELCNAEGRPYSLDFFGSYEPMCHSCHGLLDRDLDERQNRSRRPN